MPFLRPSPRRSPAWLNAAVNQWIEIAGSSMSNTPPSVNPGGATGPSSKVDKWGGFSIDTRSSKVWCLAGGGHADYSGNEVMRLDLSLNSPVWVEMLASSASGAVTSAAAYYSDGKPASSHCYLSQQFVENRNRAMRFGAGAVATSGSTFTNVDGYNCTVAPGVNGWDADGTYPAVTSVTYPQFIISKDPGTEDVYSFQANVAVHKWTQATNTWSAVNSGFPPIDANESAAAFDPVRARVLLVYPAGSVSHTFDPATGLFTSRTLTGSAGTALMASGGSVGMVYEATLDAYLVHTGSADGVVYSINASTFATTILGTTGGSTIPATNTRVYNKILYVPALGGVVYFPTYAANAWFLRTH